MKNSLLFICLVLSLSLSAQLHSDVTIDHHTIQSVVYNGYRRIVVQLPTDYDQKKTYPVSYVLDGNELFVSHSSIVSFLSKKRIIPEMIVVGVIQVNRNLELTHQEDSISNLQPNGGGALFEEYLIEEVIPFVDSTYGTSSYRLLTGHSLGGLFASNLALKKSVFNSFILIDPSVWWNNSALIDENKNLTNKGTDLNGRIFLAIANSLPSHLKDTVGVENDSTNSTLGIRSVLNFSKELGLSQSQSSKYYPDENHGTVPFLATYDGLKHIFSFYKKPSFQLLTDTSHLILVDHYKMVSERMGYTILPSAYDLSGLAWRCQVLEKNHDRAFNFLELYIQFYPEDGLAYMQMGKHYELIGKKKKSKEFYQKGMDKGYKNK